jgi:F-type H+-transporting ATPase subunit b
MNLSSQKSAIALSASAAALLMPVSAFAEDGAAGADILIPKMAEFIPALIAFLIIWIVLAKVALPGIMKTMEERGKKIEESLDEAEKTKQEAIAKRAESDSIVTDARRQAADIVLEARKDAECARIIEAAHKEAEEIIAKAHTTVEDERKSIYAGAASSIADLSVAVATKIVGEALEDDAEQKKLIERYIQEAGSLNAD